MSTLQPPATPVPLDLRLACAVTDTSFEDVHDAHVRAVLRGLSEQIIDPETATLVLQSMTDIADAMHYGETQEVVN